MIHKKKTWPDLFEQVLIGKKTFDLRLADHNIEVGDTIILEEYDPSSESYTGRTITKIVSHILHTDELPFWNYSDIQKYGYQVMSFESEEKTLSINMVKSTGAHTYKCTVGDNISVYTLDETIRELQINLSVLMDIITSTDTISSPTPEFSCFGDLVIDMIRSRKITEYEYRRMNGLYVAILSYLEGTDKTFVPQFQSVLDTMKEYFITKKP